MVFEPGRILEVVIKFDCDRFLHICGAHNYDIQPSSLANFETHIKEQVQASKSDPFKHMFILCGDLNLVPTGDKPILLKNPFSFWEGSTPLLAPPPIPSNISRGRWKRILDSLIEIQNPMPNHVCFGELTLNNINRMFSSLPRSALAITTNHSGCIRDPVWWFSKKLSDHSPYFGESLCRNPTIKNV